MNKLPLFILIIVIICINLTSIFSQNFVPILGLTNSGTGERAAGMGFAYSAVSNDMSAFTWNPAGLAQLEKITFDFEGKVCLRGRTNDLSTGEQPKTFGDYWLNFAGIGIPVNSGIAKFTFGLGIRKLYLWNDIEHSPVYYYDYEGGINGYGLATALELWNCIALGISYQEISGDLKIKKSQPMDITATGNIIELGFLFKTPSGLHIGGKYGAPSDLDMDIKDYSTSTGWLSFNFTGKYKIVVPDFFNVGIAYLASKNTILSFDYHSEPWSASRLNNLDWGENLKWIKKDVNSIHIGFEYTGYKHPIRFGFCTVPTVFQDDKKDQIIYYSVNSGTGFLWNNINFDVSLEYIFGSSKWEYGSNLEKTYSEALNEVRLGLNTIYHL